jgi:hypothetical protein
LYNVLPSIPAPIPPIKGGNVRLRPDGWAGNVKGAFGCAEAAIALLISDISAPLQLTGVSDACDK